MEGKTVRAITAFAVAPWPPAGLVFLIPGLGDSLSRSYFLAILAITYGLTLGVGIPSYVYIQHRKGLCRRHVLCVAGFVGFCAGMLSLHPIVAYVMGIPIGLSGGITFWLIWYRKPSAPPPP